MKRIFVSGIVLFFVFFSLSPVCAKVSHTKINTQEDFLNWYNDPLSKTCILNKDIIIDDYLYDKTTENWDYEFEQTHISKTVYTEEYSLIFEVNYDFCNGSLQIIGSGKQQPVLQLNGKYGQSNIHSLFVEATDGNAMSIAENQKINVIMDIDNDFPIQLKAKNYALMNYGDVEFLTTQFLTENNNAIYTADNAYTELKCCEINKQENWNLNENQLYMEDTYVSSQLVNDYGSIYYENTDSLLYVKNMEDFHQSSLPQIDGSYGWNDFHIKINWDLSTFDISKIENKVVGKIFINPLFQYLLDISEVTVIVIEKEPQPLSNFNIELQDWNIGTYRPWLTVTYPQGHEEVFLEVYRSAELLYRSYDITEDIKDYYNENFEDVYFMIPSFSEISANEIYYCRLKVVGGLYEGESNFVKLHNGTVENISPFPPSDDQISNGENTKPDTADPNDTSDGSGGHRGDQNRTDVPDEEHQIIMQPEQIEGLDKTQEDAIIIIDNQQFTIAHSLINEWHHSKKEVTVSVENNQATYQIGNGEIQKLETKISQKSSVQNLTESGVFEILKDLGVIAIPTVGIIGGVFYRRKKYGK